MEHVERREAVVVGGGQAGLSTAYELTRGGLDIAVLEADPRVGDAWRRRWDSLRLFTPARYDTLPGLAFPAPSGSYPSKDEMANYLETYAHLMALPVRTGVRVRSVTRKGSTYLLETTAGTIESDHVVVAAGHDRTYIPEVAASIASAVSQLHSGGYRSPSQLDGPGRGVGAALLEMLERLMRERGIRAVRAEASSNARDFYLRRGYRGTGVQTPDGAWPIAKPL